MKPLIAFAVVGLGMIGLQQGIEYSGWVLFVGCLCVVGTL